MGCPVFDTACPGIPQLDSPKILRICLSPGECIKYVSNQIRLLLESIPGCIVLSLSAFGCVAVAFRLEHHQRDGFPYLPSYIDESWWLHFVYSLSFQSGNIHISYSCFSLRLLPVSFRILHPLVPLPTPTWSCPSTYIYSGTWQNIPTPCQSLPNIFMRRLCTPE